MPDAEWYRAQLEAAASDSIVLEHRDTRVPSRIVRTLSLKDADLSFYGDSIIVLENLTLRGSDCDGEICIPEELHAVAPERFNRNEDSEVSGGVVILSYEALYNKAVELELITKKR